MRLWRSGLFWQFFVACGGVLLLAVAVVTVAALQGAEADALARIDRELELHARLILQAVRDGDADVHALAEMDGVSLRVTPLGPDGAALPGRDPGEPGPGPYLTRLLHGDSPDAPVAAVRVAVPHSVLDARLGPLRSLVWGTAGLAGGAGLLVVFLLTRRLIGPLQDLTEDAEQIAAGDFGRRVFAGGSDEIGILARSFNHTSERLAAQFVQINEDRQRLRAVLSSMVEGVVAVDAGQRILFANERAGHLLDFETRGAVGRRLWEVVRHRPIQDVVQSALSDARGHQLELDWTGLNARSLMVHAGPLPGRPPRGAVLVLHDTTELRRLESLRQEFVANVSHELKTPLAVIKAITETLLEGGALEDESARGTFVRRIADHADRLHNLIVDLLSLARIESGAETFVFQAVPLVKVVEECLSRRQPLAEARSQTLAAEPPAEPVAAWADEEALLILLDNLVDNAVKYTAEGGRVTVRWWAEGEQVFLQVRDTGVGIPEDQLPRVFERFYRVDRARSRELGGTGLGLSIVKHLAQAMQGSVAANSRVGAGSTFTVRLPRPPA